jgi:twitching motility protein PilT
MEVNIDDLLRQAVAANATDVHLKVGSAPVARVDGELRRFEGFEKLQPDDTKAYAEALFTSRAATDFKTSGAADFAYGKHELGRFRVTAFRQRGSVSLVLRRVVPGSASFRDLGLPSIVEKLASEESGLLLVTGPSGSGKTSSMSAIVDYINSHRAAAILTVEDPIEVLHPDKRSVVVQREVGVDTTDFAEAVRGALRHDTDVIVVSEIDDVETAHAAITAAETGHLVISSMRTTDPADTISRLVSLFPESKQVVLRSQIAAQLTAILSQRLIETTGAGHVLACEVLTNSERTQEWILGGAEPADLVGIIQDSEFFGMQTFDQAILKLVVDRVVDVPPAIPQTRNVHEMRAKAQAAGVDI